MTTPEDTATTPEDTAAEPGGSKKKSTSNVNLLLTTAIPYRVIRRMSPTRSTIEGPYQTHTPAIISGVNSRPTSPSVTVRKPFFTRTASNKNCVDTSPEISEISDVNKTGITRTGSVKKHELLAMEEATTKENSMSRFRDEEGKSKKKLQKSGGAELIHRSSSQKMARPTDSKLPSSSSALPDDHVIDIDPDDHVVDNDVEERNLEQIKEDVVFYATQLIGGVSSVTRYYSGRHGVQATVVAEISSALNLLSVGLVVLVGCIKLVMMLLSARGDLSRSQRNKYNLLNMGINIASVVLLLASVGVGAFEDEMAVSDFIISAICVVCFSVMLYMLVKHWGRHGL